MNSFVKRLGSALTASAMMLTAGIFVPVQAADTGADAAPLFTAEAEDCTLLPGASVTTNVYGTEYPGYSGDGFVWAGNAGGMTFEVDVPENAMYELTTRCWMYLGDPGTTRMQTMAIDGDVKSSIYIPNNEKWQDSSFGFFYLEKGKHTIDVGASGSWGFILYDTVTFDFADMPELNIAPNPCDKNATAETKALMKYMTSQYGNHIISGQQEIYGGGNDGDSEKEFNYIKDNTGKLPAIRGFDFMNYNPLYGWDDGTSERAIEWAKDRNGIVTASWHINVPIDFDNYTLGDIVDWKECTYKNYQASNSTFNTANAVKEGTKEYEYFQEAMKDLAEQLQKLQDANVPIILRPLHEAQGNEGNYGDGTSWFWWGDRGAEVYKELWKLLYTTLTEKYNLHNIIWEYNSYNYANSDTWYPGDDYVDIVAYDKYNCDYNRDDGLSSGTPNLSAISPIFNYLYELTNGKKMVAMAENDSIPSEENMVIENAGWLYFCPWYGDHLMSSQYNDPAQLKKMYTSDYCITLDELPEDLYGGASVEPGTTLTTKETSETVSETTTVTETSATETSETEKSSETASETTTETTKESVTTSSEEQTTETTETTESSATTASATTATETETTVAISTTESKTSETSGSVDPKNVLYGDVNLDGRVDITDAVLLNKVAAGAVTLDTAEKQVNADCDANGEVDSKDAVVLLKFLVSLIKTLPSAE